MQSAIERRQQVLEAISDRRTERIENLASEFGVSRRTIERDILVWQLGKARHTMGAIFNWTFRKA